MTDYRQRLQVLARHEAAPEPWYRIEAKAGAKSAQVDLYGVIGGWFGDVDTAAFVKEVRALDVDEIQLSINSPGGSAFDGVAIRNVLAAHKARVTATVEGFAASAASVVAMAADDLVMARGASLMIHEASGVCMGNADDMTETATMLDKLSESMAGLYADRAGGDASDWRTAMKAETWYTADEAVEAGLADRVLPKAERDVQEAKARVDLRPFAYAYADRADAPAPFMPAAHAAHKPPAAEPVESPTPTQEVAVADATDTLREGLRQRLGVTDADASDDTLLAALDESLAEAEPTPETPQASGGPDLLAEVTRLSSELAEVHAREASREKAAFFDAAVSQGRIKPAERAEIEAMYDSAPDATKAFVLAKAVGSAVPVAAIGHDGGIEQNDDDALYESLFGKKG